MQCPDKKMELEAFGFQFQNENGDKVLGIYQANAI